MSRIVGLAEIVLWTADRARSLGFYRDLLGLELISPPDMPNAFLKAGEGRAGIPQMLVLVPRPPSLADQPAGNQLHHLALELRPADFEAQRRALIAAGYQPRSGQHPVVSSRTMYVDDPDGNEVEFICQDG